MKIKNIDILFDVFCHSIDNLLQTFGVCSAGVTNDMFWVFYLILWSVYLEEHPNCSGGCSVQRSHHRTHIHVEILQTFAAIICRYWGKLHGIKYWYFHQCIINLYSSSNHKFFYLCIYWCCKPLCNPRHLWVKFDTL